MLEKYLVQDKGFYKNVVALMIPSGLQSVISYAVGMIGTLFLGKLGDEAVAAASLGSQPFFILLALSFGLSSGAMVLISQYWGKGDVATIRRIMGISVRFIFLGTAILTAICLLAPHLVMRLFTTEPTVLAMSARYLQVTALGFFFYTLSANYMMSLRAVESVKMSTAIYAVSFVINAFVSNALIFGRFGLPALGFLGAAAGVVASRISEFVLSLAFMLLFEKRVGFRYSDALRGGGAELTQDYMHHSLPVVGNELMWGFGSMALGAVMGRMGSTFVAAYSIVGIAWQISMILAMGLMSAAAVMTGKEIGRPGSTLASAQKVANTFMVLAVACGLFASGAALALRGPLLSYYQISPEAYRATHDMIGSMAILAVPMSLHMCNLVGLLRGGGDVRTAFLYDTIGIWLISLPLTIIGGLVLQLPPAIVYFLIRGDSVAGTILTYLRVRSGRWIRNVTRDTV